MFLLVMALLTAIAATALTILTPLLLNYWRIRSAKQSAKHYILTPTGNTPETWDEASTPLAAIISNLKTKTGIQQKLAGPGGLTIHRWTKNGATHNALTIWGTRNPDKTAASIGLAIGAKTEPTEPQWKLYLDNHTHRTTRGAFNQESAPAGENLHRTAKWVTDQLNLAEDASIHISIQPMTPSETKNYTQFTQQKQHQQQQVAQTLGTLSRTQIITTSPDPTDSETLADGICKQIPNYLFATKSTLLTDRKLAGQTIIVPVLAHATLLLVAPVWTQMFAAATWIMPYVLWSNRLHLNEKLVLNRLEHGVIYTPSKQKRGWRLAKALLRIGFQSQQEGDSTNQEQQLSDTKLNLPATTLPFNTGHVAAVFAPTSQLSTAGAATRSRTQQAPQSATQAQGTNIGYDINGKQVNIPDQDREGGIFVPGDPGSGKTVALTGVWYNDVVHKLKPSTDPRTLVWVETKGEGAKTALQAAAAAGAKKEDIIFIDVNNPNSPQPNYILHGDPRRSSVMLAAAMKYGFSGDAEQSGLQAEAVLNAALHVAMSIDEEAAKKIGFSSSNLDIMAVANLLVGGNESESAYERFYRRLQNLAAERAPTTEINPDSDENDSLMDIFDNSDDHFVEATKNWGQYNQLPKRERLQQTTSSRNRIAAMRWNKTLWVQNPNLITFDHIINSHKIVVINFGSPIGKSDSDGTGQATSERLASMFLYLLWETVKVSCVGWETQNKSLYIYSDELSMIAKDGGDGKNIVEAMRDQGRSYGIKLNFATQRVDQLEQDTRNAVMSFSHKIYLRTATTEIAEEYAQDLTGGQEGSYTAYDIQNLEKLNGIAKVTINGQPQPPFNISFLIPPELTKEAANEGWAAKE